MSKHTTLINQITIIGLGLMGSSLARRIKEKGLARRIVGCSHSMETLDKAKQLGIIDAAILSAGDAVKRSEVVILCTPLGTYDAIAAEIAPNLKAGSILSDVGSVKGAVIAAVVPHLRQGQLFIPAHPIAGSEKTGVDAGVSTLYEGKKVIITPAAGYHGKAACEKISALWEACGARVEVIKPEKHDHIYASMSHAVQMIAYAYSLSLESMGDGVMSAISQQKDDDFQRFTRLCSSDPTMWRDIVSANKIPIRAALEKWIIQLQRLLNDIEENNLAHVMEICHEAALIRHRLKPLSAPVVKRSYAADNLYFAPAVALPALIACVLLKTFTDTDYAGTGFQSITEPALYEEKISEKRLEEHKIALLQAAKKFIIEIQKISDNIAGEKFQMLITEFIKSRNTMQFLLKD